MTTTGEQIGKQFEKHEIIALFEAEFAGVRDRFGEIIDLTLDIAEDFRSPEASKPGVYVFWKDHRVWKVGRHLVNSRMRAVEHVNVPTSKNYSLTDLKGKSDAHIFLFNVKEHDPINGRDFRHWVAALEIFFELRLDPKEKSGRLG